VSRVFYTLREKRNDYKLPYKIIDLEDDSYIKIGIALDRLDTLDTFKTLPEVDLAEKLEQLKTWLIENKNDDGLVDAAELASKITELGLEVQKTVQLLKDEFWIRDVPDVGKWGVGK
jgi:hypothetical protein